MIPLRKLFLIFLLFLTACTRQSPQTWFDLHKDSIEYNLTTHPDGPLYVGDQVSFEVYGKTSSKLSGQSIQISLGQKKLAEGSFESFGISGRSQVTFFWIWDTRGLDPGVHTLTFSVLPGGTRWDYEIVLRPASEVPAPEPEARWESVDSACCTIHYISGTEAAEDLDALKIMVDAQAIQVAERMRSNFDKKIPITFLPRTLGHGGFTSNGIYVSYLHRNYAGSTTRQVTHHEMVHWLDNQLGGDLRPSILREGLAVYLSDGHFKVEPILPRAAAILDLGLYIPLRELADSFYFSQHELGYAQAAALVNYLVTTYGWDNFNRFYRTIPPGQGSDSDALDAALRRNFSISLDQLEEEFIAFLRAQRFNKSDATDLRLTIEFYDTVRRYQKAYDPSAYFLHAWLPDVPEMRKRGIVADFVRHPDSFINRQIENLLMAADASLRLADYPAVEARLRFVNTLLDFRHE